MHAPPLVWRPRGVSLEGDASVTTQERWMRRRQRLVQG